MGLVMVIVGEVVSGETIVSEERMRCPKLAVLR